MNKIRNKYYLLLLVVGYLFPFINTETGWEYTQSPLQCFYIFEYINIDGVEATGDGEPGNVYGECVNNPYTCNVIGAFIERDENVDGDLNNDGELSSSVEVCVGWGYAKSDGWSTLPLIGADASMDATAGYLESGNIPYFKIYDYTNSVILPTEISNIYYIEDLEDLNGNGIWDGASEAEPFTDLNGNGEFDESEYSDDNNNGEWDDGELWFDENLNGIPDAAEPYEDIDGDGQWDEAIPEEDFVDLNLNGIWDESVSGELLGWINNEIFIYNGSLDAYNSFGCNDDVACNYDEDATADNGSCIYEPSGALTTQVTVTGNSFELSWNDGDLEGTEEFSHQVIISEGFTEIYNEINPQSPIELSDLDWSTIYSIDIITSNFDICESLENSLDITTDPMPAPGEVVLFNPIAGEGEVFLSWGSVNFASIYRIFSNGVLIDSVSSPSVTYVDTQLAPNSTNEYSVQAVNAEGTTGPISESLFSTTLPLSTVILDSLIVGQGQLQAVWSMEDYQYNDDTYIFDIYMDDEYLTTRYGTSHVVNSLDPGEEYCFYIISRIELPVEGELLEFITNESNEICGSPDVVSGWSVLVEAELYDAWTGGTVFDVFNELGMRPEATDGYDSALDIPEPPVTGGFDTNISLSFPHPEWNIEIGGVDQDYFTSDLRELKDLSKKLEVWNASILSPHPGSGSLLFNFVSDAGDYPIYLGWGADYTRVNDNDTASFIYNTPDIRNNFKFIIGDQAPAIPTSLVIEGESRVLNLSWDLSLDCETNGISCNDYKNRYPPTSYKVYRSWYEENVPHLISLVGTRHDRISIFPSELFASSDSLFSITTDPVDGFLDVEYFESFIDLDFNDEYDEGEEFSDCGWDGICPGEDGYASETYSDDNGNGNYDFGEDFEDDNFNSIWDENGEDIGEGDGICNVVYYYQANAYLTDGLDSLSYSNGVYDYGEDFEDENENQEWDAGETYIDSRQLNIKISNELNSEYEDTGLRTGTIYFYNVLASNNAGESKLSMMDSEETAPNIRPIADAGVDQIRYLISVSDDSVMCSFPLDNIYDEEGNEVIDDLGNPVLETINNSYDPDGLETEELTYYWELHDPDNTLDFLPEDASGLGDVGWWRIGNEETTNINLPETINLPDENYLVRLYVQDASQYYSEPDSTTIQVTRDIPAPAKVLNLVSEESLYYIKLLWDVSAYDSPGEGPNPPPEGYDGDLELADYYVVYRDSIEYQDISSDTLFFVDDQLTPEEEYIDENGNGVFDDGELYIDEDGDGDWDSMESHCYYIVAINSTGASTPSNENCYSTGVLPIPEILSPTAPSILVSGEEITITWNMSNIQYIDTVTISHSSDAGVSWYSDSSSTWSSSEIPVNFIFNIPDTDTISFYNKFKIEVLDIGDYGGVNKQIHSDITDHLITITSNELQNNYSTGWNIISTPLDLEDTNVWSNFNGMNDDMGMYFLYNENEEVCGFPQCDDSDLIFDIEEGYYMLTDDDAMLGLEGSVLVDQSIIELQQGWNLIGNPLVTKVIVDNLEFQWSDNPDDIFTFGDAVDNEFIMPTIQGFNNQTKMHEPVRILEPFYGYWIHADTTGLNLIVEPHIYDESLYSNDREEHWELTLYAKEHEPNLSLENYLWCDMIKIGLSSAAEDGMVYGEDEYDIPIVVNPASFTNMYIDQPEWEEAGAETGRFFSDIRFLEGIDVTKTWNLAGQLLGSVLSDSIYLHWDIGSLELLGAHDITFVVGDEVIDMRESNSTLIVKEYFENMQITVGPLVNDDSCESQGLVTCLDGSCAATIDDCSCESQGLVTCEDGDCAEDLEDCIDLSNEIPEDFSISRPYPNPFNPTVKFDFSLPSLDKIGINVYDINGMHVATLMNEVKPAGHYSIVWNADSEPTGMYFIQFSSKDVIKTMKVVLIK